MFMFSESYPTWDCKCCYRKTHEHDLWDMYKTKVTTSQQLQIEIAVDDPCTQLEMTAYSIDDKEITPGDQELVIEIDDFQLGMTPLEILS